MALKLWLPLISDNKNQGISNYTPTGSPASWGNGPIGGCATFNDNVSNFIKVTNDTDLRFVNSDFSYCFWINKNLAAMTSTSMHIFTEGRIDYGDTRGYGTGVQSTTQLRFWFGTSNWIISGVPDNEWHHIAFTYKNDTKIVKIYRDGVLVSTVTFGGTMPTYTESVGVCVGNFQGSIYPLIGSVCDFRIYNNTLSDKEVREIANGLLIHYKLDGVGNFGNKNLLTWNVEYSKANPLVHSGSSQDAIKYLGDASLVTLTPGKDYYISVHTDAIPGTHNTSGGTLSKRNTFTIFLYLRNQGTSKAVGGYDSAPNLNKDNIYINDPQNNTYVWKYTAPSNAQDITLRTNLYSDGSTTISHKFWDFKIEEGSYTGFTPGVNQPQYAKLGFGSTKIKDCSGYNRDGTINGTLTTDNNTAKYDSSIAFTSNNSIKYSVPAGLTKATLSFWVKVKTKINYSAFDIRWNDAGGNLWLSIGNTESNSLWAYWNGVYNMTNPTLNVNTWYHVAFTWDNGKTRWYFNGSAVGNEVDFSSKSTTWPSGDRSIGDSYTGSYWSSTIFDGSVSDWRLYGTVLPASEILRLAKNPTSVCNNGTLITEEVTESQAPNVAICRSGISNGICVSELPGKYDNRLYIEPDGSCWVRIVHHADPTSYKFASSDSFRTGVYKDDRRFFDGTICDMVDKWEFMVIQQLVSTDPVYKARWIQTKNPNTATFADVPASAITRILTTGYVSHGFGGLYYKTSSTYWCCNNGASNNWWGAVGAWDAYQGGIPAMQMNGNSGIVKDTGFEDLYIRIDNVTWTSNKRTLCSFDRGSKGILASEFVEY